MTDTATLAQTPAAQPTAGQTVTMDNFTRAESDNYFATFVKEGELGKIQHDRDLADVKDQKVVRLNRDTLYSFGVFDLDAGPVTVDLPDTKGRFMSLLLINEDHYNPATYYDAGPHTITREQVGTRYVTLAFRTFVDPNDPADLQKAHAAQDAIKAQQPGGPGKFEIPTWDQTSLTAVRNELKSRARGIVDLSKAFGKPGEVDPQQHLIATAAGWGGNPARDALYVAGSPKANDGKTVHRLTVKDVPVDGFWSLTVYNDAGFMVPNPQNAYSLNNITAKKDAGGGYTIQFGGCDEGVSNCLPIMPGWNYLVRLYRPQAVVLDGTWKFPEAQPVD
ncbi:DUF1254 domain-containing protein [Sphingomonas limnosediminicola]|uniref:DUF1254 domain-containing protein n=1 Tax=Sphingomonas limnosediminicola TaxID=940133 RepID=A0ABP7L5T7_9SPHN